MRNILFHDGTNVSSIETGDGGAWRETGMRRTSWPTHAAERAGSTVCARPFAVDRSGRFCRREGPYTALFGRQTCSERLTSVRRHSSPSGPTPGRHRGEHRDEGGHARRRRQLPCRTAGAWRCFRAGRSGETVTRIAAYTWRAIVEQPGPLRPALGSGSRPDAIQQKVKNAGYVRVSNVELSHRDGQRPRWPRCGPTRRTSR